MGKNLSVEHRRWCGAVSNPNFSAHREAKDYPLQWHLPDRNQNTFLILKAKCPELKSEKGQNYTDILARLFATRLDAFASSANKDDRHDLEAPTSRPLVGDATVTVSKRIRNKDHLKFVASQPCLICGRENVEAHHILFAEPRAMGKKVGDQWTVPLCAFTTALFTWRATKNPGS